MYFIGFFGARRVIQNEPGPFIGPIATVFGYIIDFIFNAVNAITVYHSLGISIILLTIIVRTLMLPLAIKQQKSMMAMQKLNPEMQKIRAKYPDKKDAQTMNAEIQKLYADNKVNPLGGCLPHFIQMPMFFGLSFIMHQSHLYVSRLGALFSGISEILINNMPRAEFMQTMNEIAVPLAPDRMIRDGELNMTIVSHVNRVLNAFTSHEWNILFDRIPAEYLPQVLDLHGQAMAIQTFLGMPLTEATGLGWPGIMIPILAVLSAVLTSWITMKSSVVTDEKQKQQQKIMMAVMPVMMGAMTIGLPAGVGIFWITSSVYQIGQQLFMNKKMSTADGTKSS